MKNTRTKILDLPNIAVDEQALEDIIMVNPIKFITEEESNGIIERVKDGLKNINNPKRWLTCEECEQLAKERYGV